MRIGTLLTTPDHTVHAVRKDHPGPALCQGVQLPISFVNTNRPSSWLDNFESRSHLRLRFHQFNFFRCYLIASNSSSIIACEKVEVKFSNFLRYGNQSTYSRNDIAVDPGYLAPAQRLKWPRSRSKSI